ncbi:MAG: sulfurtransferase, partial [Gemmatimonadota bacterium]
CPGRFAAVVLAALTVAPACSPGRSGEAVAPPAPAASHRLAIGADSLAARLATGREPPLLLHVARAGAEYDSAHVAGARLLRLGDIVVERDGIPNELPPRARLDSVLAATGVTGGANVVVYGEPLAAARAFFTLDVVGQGDRAAVLDGGLPAWRAAEHPVSRAGGDTIARPAVRTRAPSSPALESPVVDAAWIEARRGNAKIALIDARPPEEFSGEKPGDGVDRPGHIPGARSLFWKKLLRSDSLPLLQDTATLRKLFVDAGAAPGDTVVTYCRTGMQASYAYFVARYLGYESRMYDGSYLDWVRVPSRAVERGRDAAGTGAGR